MISRATTAPHLVTNVEFQRILLTPTLAAKFLEHNRCNRELSHRTADCYGRDIKAGNWGECAQPIQFTRHWDDPECLMLDGQHRCMAVCRAGVSVHVWVAINVPEESGNNTDRNRPKGFRDRMKFKGRPISTRGEALIRRIDRMATGRTNKLSDREMEVLWERNEDAIAWACSLPRVSRVTRAASLAPLSLAHELYPAEVEAFTDAVISGEGLSATSPELRIRDRLLQTAQANREVSDVLALETITALGFALDGRPMKVLRASPLHWFKLRKDLGWGDEADVWATGVSRAKL
jgi:hypothetical protein